MMAIGFDAPHVIRKDQTMYYAFFAKQCDHLYIECTDLPAYGNKD
jgi:hypothetical protein